MSPPSRDYFVSSQLSKVNYENATAAKKDILNALHHYGGLSLIIDDFTFNYGDKRKLACLDGTIPVPYRGSNYNIPVRFWLLPIHPLQPPICYVRPSSNMKISVSRSVDSDGKIYLPYLHEWNATQSNLLGLIQVTIFTFMEKPPVYSISSPPPSLPYPTTTVSAVPHNYPSYPNYPPINTPYPQEASNNLYPPFPYNFKSLNGSENNITQENIRASVLSAVEDKLKRVLREEYETKSGEMHSLHRMKDELNIGSEKIKSAIQQIERDESTLDYNMALLQSSQDSINEALKKLEASPEMNPDDVVLSTTPLYNQLLNIFAEESALQDAIYYLGEGLQRGVIECETFLKYVRKLSRKQFLLRATMIKCREKAGLAI